MRRKSIILLISLTVLLILCLVSATAMKRPAERSETASTKEASTEESSIAEDIIAESAEGVKTTGNVPAVENDVYTDPDEDSTTTDAPVHTSIELSPTPPDPTRVILHPASDRKVLRDGFSSQSLPAEIIEKITGVSYHENDTITYEDLSYLQVLYMDFDHETQVGELICNEKIADDLLEIFAALYDAEYPIEKIRLVDEYGADDDASCADDNTSCFNYRVVPGSTHLSNHAKGLAIDINPFYNPYVTYPDGREKISPPGSEPYADRSNKRPYMIDESDLCYKLFKEHGFTWGGHWKSLKDYQHFEKPLP